MLRHYTARGKMGYNVTFRILAGTPAPLAIEKFWSTRVMHALSRRVGFSWSDGNRPDRHPTEFSQLRLLGLIEAARSVERPFFHKVDCWAPCSITTRTSLIIGTR